MELETLLFHLQAHPWSPLPARQKYGYAVTVRTPGEALAHLRACAENAVARKPSRLFSEALTLERVKIGYFAGYYDLATRQRVERLYRCVHPYAGPATDLGGRHIQLVGDFDLMCQVWDRAPLSAYAFGAHRQPPWCGPVEVCRNPT